MGWLFVCALWHPQSIQSYLEVRQPTDELDEAEKRALIQKRREIGYQSDILSLIGTVFLSTIALFLYDSLLATNLSTGEFIGALIVTSLFWWAGLVYKLVVEFLVRNPESYLDDLPLSPSLSIPINLLVASAAVPLSLRQIRDVPWAFGPDLIWISLAAIWGGIFANLLIITRKHRAQLSLSSILWWDIFVGFASLAVVSLIVSLGNEKLSQEDWLPLLSTALVSASLFHFSTLRPIDWVYGILFTERNIVDAEIWHVPCVTPLVVPTVRDQLARWFDLNFVDTLRTAESIWENTFQHKSIVDAMLKVFAAQDADKAIQHVLSLAEKANENVLDVIVEGKKARHFLPSRPPSSANPGATKKLSPSEERRKLRDSQRRLRKVAKDLKLDTGYEWMAAGCYFLNACYPSLAADAFRRAGTSSTAKEMTAISEAFEYLWNTEELTAKAEGKLPIRFNEAKRKDTWKIIEKFDTTLNYLWAARQSGELENNGAAILTAAIMLAEIPDLPELPRPERYVIQMILDEWSWQLSRMLRLPLKRGKLKPQPVTHVYSRPVGTSDAFAGRHVELKALKDGLTIPNTKPIWIYGPRYVGKTSLLRIAREQLGRDAEMLIVDMRHMSSGQAALLELAREVCMRLVGQSLRQPPDFLKTPDNPYTACVECIELALSGLIGRKLIIALDHAEEAFRVLGIGNYLDSLAAFLQKLHQRFPQITYVLTTSDPLPSLNPGTSLSWLTTGQQIRLGRLSHKEVKKLLHFDEDRLHLKYKAEAINLVNAYSAGHPVFVQAIASYVIQTHNFARENDGVDPFVTELDIHNVVQSEEFGSLCSEYCMGIVEPARLALPNCQIVLRTLAQNEAGVEFHDLLQQLTNLAAPIAGLNIQTLRDMLKTLEAYDLISLQNEFRDIYGITIPLVGTALRRN